MTGDVPPEWRELFDRADEHETDLQELITAVTRRRRG